MGFTHLTLGKDQPPEAPPRVVNLGASAGVEVWREMPQVAFNVDVERIMKRLKGEFNAGDYSGIPVTTDLLVEMIGYGVMLTLEELAHQAQQNGNTAILVTGPSKGS